MKKQFSFSQIINMNIGFFGIQYSFALQQSAVNPIYDMLGATPDQIAQLNLAGPVTGLLIQPIIGALSDKTYSAKWGRRKPYFLIGAIVCSLCLLVYPFSNSLWMAAGLLWLLDAGNNTAMEPYRAFIGDKLSLQQQPKGFLAQSFFTGFGQTLANLSLFIFPIFIIGKTGKIPNWVFASFFLGSILSIASIWWSMKTTPEDPLSEEELLALKSEKLNVLSPFIDVLSAIKTMPKKMWLLAVVYLFQWYALFCYWQNSSKAIAINSFGWHVPNEQVIAAQNKLAAFKTELKTSLAKTSTDYNDVIKRDTGLKQLVSNNSEYTNTKLSDADINILNQNNENDIKYEEAVKHSGLVNGWYNLVTFLVAFILARLATRVGARKVHAIALLLSAIGFITFAFISNKYLLLLAITGFGIGWASIMGVPFLLVNKVIPNAKRGVYMGIINMMIVIPMLIQTLTFGSIMRNVLNNNSVNAIMFAGILLLIAALLTFVFFKDEVEEQKTLA
jgi:maltose/moltooligosaccharide transporter